MDPISIWIALGWSALIYIAIREKWNDVLGVFIFFLLLVPTAIAGLFVWAIAIIFIPTDKFLDRQRRL